MPYALRQVKTSGMLVPAASIAADCAAHILSSNVLCALRIVMVFSCRSDIAAECQHTATRAGFLCMWTLRIT